MFFVAFSTLAWDEAGGAHNPAQLARALARRGHAVLYVEPQPSPQRETGGLPLEIAALTELGMTPMQLRRAWFGVPGGADEELEMLRRVWESLCARTERSGDARRIALYSAPFDPVVRLLPLLHSSGWTVVYYAMDDFTAAPALGYTQFDPRAEEYLVSRADLLAGVTPHTARTLARAGKTTHVIPNGIDLAFFRDGERGKAPVIARGALTLGFWGTVMESLVDADLIEYVARARPDWTIHLLGAVDPEPHRRSIAAQLKGLTNVHLHGRVPHSALASYAAAFDVMLAPMPDTAFTRGRDPLKVYEYLAAHKPVVAAYAPQLANVPGVYVAWSPDEFIGAVERAVRTPMDTQAVDDFLAHQSWAARAETLLALLDRVPARAAVAAPPAAAPTAPLATFIQLDLNAALRYAAALENELDAVQAWARELEANLQARSRRSRWLSPIARGVKTRSADAPHRSKSSKRLGES